MRTRAWLEDHLEGWPCRIAGAVLLGVAVTAIVYFGFDLFAGTRAVAANDTAQDRDSAGMVASQDAVATILASDWEDTALHRGGKIKPKFAPAHKKIVDPPPVKTPVRAHGRPPGHHRHSGGGFD